MVVCHSAWSFKEVVIKIVLRYWLISTTISLWTRVYSYLLQVLWQSHRWSLFHRLLLRDLVCSCSVQRRHWKNLFPTPPPFLSWAPILDRSALVGQRCEINCSKSGRRTSSSHCRYHLLLFNHHSFSSLLLRVRDVKRKKLSRQTAAISPRLSVLNYLHFLHQYPFPQVSMSINFHDIYTRCSLHFYWLNLFRY